MTAGKQRMDFYQRQLHAFALAANAVLAEQRKYFKTRDQANLIRSKTMEQQLAVRIRAVLEDSRQTATAEELAEIEREVKEDMG